ncbi:MAG: pyridoxal phosphate-dependent aminotransferase [Alphaproteobacteria bacterium]
MVTDTKMPAMPVSAADRLATESAFAVSARAAELAAEGRDIINLGIGQPDFPTPPHIVEAGIRAMQDGHHGYTAPEGIPAVRDGVADDLHRRYGVDVSPDRVTIVPGGKVTMHQAILLCGEPGVEILYPDPGFPIYRSMIAYTGATPVPYPVGADDGFAMKADTVLGMVTDRTRLLILNSPGNPTGGVTPKQDLDRLVAGLEERPDIAILSDEIYGHLVYDGAEHTSLLSYPSVADRLILLDGWSKAYAMTGWRMGYAVWPQAWINTVTRLSVNSFSCVNAPAQYAGLAALTGPQDCVETMRRAFDERRRYLIPALNDLPGLSCAESRGAFYAFPSVRETGLTATAFQTELIEQCGVATLAGSGFGANGDGYVRFSYANSLQRIEEAVSRIRDHLNAR